MQCLVLYLIFTKVLVGKTTFRGNVMNYAVLLSDKVTYRVIVDKSEVMETEFFSDAVWAVRNDRLGYQVIGHPSECPAGHHIEFINPNCTPEIQALLKGEGRDGVMRDFIPRKDLTADRLNRIITKELIDNNGAPTALAIEARNVMHQVEGLPQRPAVKAAKASGTKEELLAALNAEMALISMSSTLRAKLKYAEIGV